MFSFERAEFEPGDGVELYCAILGFLQRNASSFARISKRNTVRWLYQAQVNAIPTSKMYTIVGEPRPVLMAVARFIQRESVA